MQPFYIVCCVSIANALIWDGPKSTDAASLVTPSISPKPTKVAKFGKRDAWPASFCGFVGGISCQFL